MKQRLELLSLTPPEPPQSKSTKSIMRDREGWELEVSHKRPRTGLWEVPSEDLPSVALVFSCDEMNKLNHACRKTIKRYFQMKFCCLLAALDCRGKILIEHFSYCWRKWSFWNDKWVLALGCPYNGIKGASIHRFLHVCSIIVDIKFVSLTKLWRTIRLNCPFHVRHKNPSIIRFIHELSDVKLWYIKLTVWL